MDWLIALLVLAGAVLTLIGSLGLVILPDTLSRLHAPTKTSTLGVACLLMASILYFWPIAANLHEVLITAFLFLTAPVSAHLIGRLALRHGSDKAPHALPPEDASR
ncbi:multicomponent K+:H+ antiporter subunit G [Chitinivorax tropicus]|uniref:Multicomponent K+:H+ antiporter subunit G n=1 Tax=Chitinivorax tropicus TaxID=714531 RepID=A0A840MKF2_9PROT|nr:monovalent cation/H(+) antiporter subunit G [Chitinivorax tropicus]MBB5019664.1 multicomponent K+:H+ antiporter subunit G [Chitinivorax tropicus]